MIARVRFTHAHAFAEMKFSFGNSAFRRASLSFEINNLTSRARRGLRATSSLLDLRAVASAAARFFHFAPLQGGILAMAGPALSATNQRASVATSGHAPITAPTANAAARMGSLPITGASSPKPKLPSPPTKNRKDHRNELPHEPEQLQHHA